MNHSLVSLLTLYYSDINACFPHYMEFQVWLFCYIQYDFIMLLSIMFKLFWCVYVCVF